MNCLVSLTLAICMVYAVQGHTVVDNMLKVKREASIGSRLFQDSNSKVQTRERRSLSGKQIRSFFFLDNRSGQTAQLWYRNTSDPSKTKHEYRWSPLESGKTMEINTYDFYEWTATMKESGKLVPLMIKDKMAYVQESNTEETRTTCIIKRQDQTNTDLGVKYMEILVVVDKSVRDRFSGKHEAKRFIKIVLNLASRVYQHRSLTQTGVTLHLVTSKIIFLNDEIKFDPKKRGSNLYTACRRMNEIGNVGSMRFDHKIFFTRNAFGAGGYARKYGMCSQYSSCSIVYEHGFSTAFMVAHEIGHSLGMSHGDFPQYSRYLLAEYLDALFTNHRWSTQSQQSLLKYIRGNDCLNNKPTKGKPGIYFHRPGKHYSLEKQCDLEYDESYTKWTWAEDPCEKLRCGMPGKYSWLSKSPGSPPLDGTECGLNKWCISGKCTLKTHEAPAAKIAAGQRGVSPVNNS